MQMTKKTTIVFDFDGTLVNTFPFIIDVVNKLALHYGFQRISDKDIELIRSLPPLDIIKKYKIPFYKIPFIVRKGQSILKEEINKAKFFEGMIDVLKSLKQKGYVLGILSSNSKKNVLSVLKHNKVEDLFAFVHSELNIFGKHRSLEKIINKYHLKKEDVLYVGDEVRDIEACKKTGIDVAAVTWGFNTKEILMKYSPTIIVEKPTAFLHGGNL